MVSEQIGCKQLIHFLPFLSYIYLLVSLKAFLFPFCLLISPLSVLDLSFNQFNSSIPRWLFNLTSLTKLDLGYNALQGTIPYNFVNLRNLVGLDMSGNQNITGQLPSFFGNFCKLKTLVLSGTISVAILIVS